MSFAVRGNQVFLELGVDQLDLSPDRNFGKTRDDGSRTKIGTRFFDRQIP
jgi:hypothetical protein